MLKLLNEKTSGIQNTIKKNIVICTNPINE